MFQWIWDHIIVASAVGLLDHIPWWGWAVLAAVIVGLLWRFYKLIGWQGVAAALAVMVTFGVYRQGWQNAMTAHAAKQINPPTKKAVKPTIFNPSGVRDVKRHFDFDKNVWVNAE